MHLVYILLGLSHNAMQCSASSFAAATAAAAAETYLYSTRTRTQAIEKHVYLSEQAYVM